MKKDANTFLLIAGLSLVIYLINQKRAAAKVDTVSGLPFDRRRWRVNRP